MTYEIPTINLKRLGNRIAKIGKRARRLGLDAPVMTEGEAVERTIVDEDGMKKQVRCVMVEITGTEPRYEGWLFLAALDHLDEGQTMMRTRGTVEGIVEQYADAGPDCDHCKARRRRNTTYVVEKDGERKQLGSTCLKDYMGGHGNPEAVAAAFEMIQGIEAFASECEEWEDDRPRGSAESGVELEHWMILTSWATRVWGFVPRGYGDLGDMPTSTRVEIAIDRHEGDPNDADRVKAAAAIEWMESLNGTEEQYLHNLSVLAGLGFVPLKHRGLAASAVRAYDRHVEKEMTANLVDEHFGTIKKREVFKLTILSYRTFDDGQYGPRYLLRWKDQDNRPAVWWASNPPDLEIGTTYQVKATVKDHAEYKGRKQTVLTRCAMVEAK